MFAFIAGGARFDRRERLRDSVRVPLDGGHVNLPSVALQLVPDGIQQEDAAVELVVSSEIRDRIDIDEMLNRLHGRPLREEISDRIVAMVAAFTGKSV